MDKNKTKLTKSKVQKISIGTIIVLGIIFGYFYYRGLNPVESVQYNLSFGDIPEYSYIFAVYGKNKDFNDPHEVLVFDNDIYVSDYGNGRISVFDDKGNPIRDIVNKEMKNPAGMFWDGASLWVVDPTVNKVLVFETGGKLLKSLKLDKTVLPVDVAVDNGVMYLLNNRRMTVEKYDLKTMKKIGIFGGFGNEPGRLYYPSNLVVKDNLVYVVDSMNGRINVYNVNGVFVKSLPKLAAGSKKGLSAPRGLAFDKEGRLYMVEGMSQRVTVLNKEGEIDLQLTESETINGQVIGINLPTDVAIDNNSGRLYVLEYGFKRLLVYKRH